MSIFAYLGLPALFLSAFLSSRSIDFRLRQLRRQWPLLAMLFVVAGALAQTAHYGGTLADVGTGWGQPLGVAVDASGNVFIADHSCGTVMEVLAGTGGAGSGKVSLNSTVITVASGFGFPEGVAVDASGNVFVTDTSNSTVNEIVAVGGHVPPSPTVVTLGSGFNSPLGVAVDPSGDLFVADTFNSALKEFVAVGGVIPSGSTAITVTSVTFSPGGVAVDASGNVFLTDRDSKGVWEIAAGTGTAPAGQIDSSSTLTKVATGFLDPIGVAVDASGDVFVADASGSANWVKEIVAVNGQVSLSSTVMTWNGLSGPFGVAVSTGGDIIATYPGYPAVEKFELAVTDFGTVNVGSTSLRALIPFTFDSAGAPSGWSVETQGAQGLDYSEVTTGGGSVTTCATTAYSVGDACIVAVEFSPKRPGQRMGAVQLLDASGHVIATAHLNGIGSAPQVVFPSNLTPVTVGSGFSGPYAVAVDASGNVFVADTNHNAVKEISGATINLVGNGFSSPRGVAVDGSGNVFVADTSASAIKEILAVNGVVSSSSQVIPVGSGFNQPYGVAVDAIGNVFVADTYNQLIKEIVAVNGQVSSSSAVITLATTTFGYPVGVAVDANGDVFFADTNNRKVKEIVAVNGQVSSSSTVIQAGTFPGTSFPLGVTVDSNGDVFAAVSDSGNSAVYEVVSGTGGAASGQVSSSSTTKKLGSGFSSPAGVAVDASGNVFVADTSSSAIGKLDFADPPSLTFPTPTLVGEVDTTDGQKTVTVTNLGNATLTFPIPFTGLNPSTSIDFTLDSSAGTDCQVVSSYGSVAPTLASGASCDLRISFTPQEGGAIAGAVVLTDDSLNRPSPDYSTQTIGLSGTANAAFVSLVSGTPQSTPVATAFSSLVIQVTDDSANPISGAPVTFTANTGLFGQSGNFSNNSNTITGTTGTDGTLSEAFTANTISGFYTVTAQIGSTGSSVNFKLTNDPGPAIKLDLLNLFENAPLAYTGWPVYLAVFAADQYDNPVATLTADTLTVTSDDSGAVLPPDFVLAGVGFFQATLNTPGTQLTVTDASNSAIPPVTTNLIVMVPPSLVVTTTADDPFPGNEDNCTPPGTNNCSLRDALNFASSWGAGSITFDPTLVPAGSVITLGPTPGNALDIPNDTSITSSTAGGITVSGGGITNVFTMGDPNAQGIIDGLTITGGYIYDATPDTFVPGSAIANNGTLTVKHSTISNNSSSAPNGEVDGGAIFTDNDLEISDSTVSNNTGTGLAVFGGGIANVSYINATNLTLMNNSALASGSGDVEGDFGANGGGISTNCADFLDSTISGNVAQDTDEGAFGGGIAAFACINVTNTTVSGNISTSGGVGNGGGLYVYDTMQLYNSTVAGNTSDDGGGIFNDGGGLFLANTIVSGNTSPIGSDYDYDLGGALTDNQGNLVGLSASDINLAPLGNYGGATQTMLPLPGSPAICAGLASIDTSAGITSDQRDLGFLSSYCPSGFVDSGAVQTNYALTFTTEPPSSFFTTQAISPAPVVALTESGTAATGVSSAIAMTDNASLLGGTTTVNLASGSATFSNLVFSSTTGSDMLTATLALTPALNLTTQSTPFTVNPVPPVTLSTASLDFGSQKVGSSSPTQLVIMTNNTGATLSISSIVVSGTNASSFVFGGTTTFVIRGSCGATLAAGASCLIHGHFAPTISGPLSASITITDSASNSPQSIFLTGTGVDPDTTTLSLTSTSLTFSPQLIGTNSPSQFVKLTNTGGAILSIVNIGVTGPNASSFVFATNCPRNVAIGAGCLIHGHFTPTARGPLTATVLLIDSATGSPQSITLTGMGITPQAVTLTSTSLAFAAQAVGTTGASQSVMLTNTGDVALRITSIAVTGANASSFIFANSCGTRLAAGASCLIHGHFTPTSTGPLSAAVTITDNAGDSPQSISLSGNGQ